MSKSPVILDEEDQLINVGFVAIALESLADEIRLKFAGKTNPFDLAVAYLKAESALRQIEPILAQFVKIIRTVQTETLPNIFEQQKMSSLIVLGHRVTTSAEMRISILKRNETATFRWLKANGHGELIKETVHHGTLSAWGKAQIEQGEELPEDLFSTYFYNTTSITKTRP